VKVKITNKIKKYGRSYVLRVPKQYIDNGTLNTTTEYIFEVGEDE